MLMIDDSLGWAFEAISLGKGSEYGNYDSDFSMVAYLILYIVVLFHHPLKFELNYSVADPPLTLFHQARYLRIVQCRQLVVIGIYVCYLKEISKAQMQHKFQIHVVPEHTAYQRCLPYVPS